MSCSFVWACFSLPTRLCHIFEPWNLCFFLAFDLCSIMFYTYVWATVFAGFILVFFKSPVSFLYLKHGIAHVGFFRNIFSVWSRALFQQELISDYGALCQGLYLYEVVEFTKTATFWSVFLFCLVSCFCFLSQIVTNTKSKDWDSP